jgi:23S rRNA-/tRNA-specific pseudouridylate synthase
MVLFYTSIFGRQMMLNPHHRIQTIASGTLLLAHNSTTRLESREELIWQKNG